MPSPRISIQAIIVIGFKKKKKKKKDGPSVLIFFFLSGVPRCGTVRVDSIKTSASDQGPQLRPSLCPSPGGS